MMVQRGDFAGIREGMRVYFPLEIEEYVYKSNLHSLEEFLASAHSFPESLANHLGWTVAEVKTATFQLLNQVDDLLDPGFVKMFYEPTRQVSFGALTPCTSNPRK